mmetsp:Transcript_20421/g.41897  ORF Transcript_20421/g.41897 Transcript_20421/m.41897 type:complete len:91 (-) Transcript_20421:54-326(-)
MLCGGYHHDTLLKSRESPCRKILMALLLIGAQFGIQRFAFDSNSYESLVGGFKCRRSCFGRCSPGRLPKRGRGVERDFLRCCSCQDERHG